MNTETRKELDAGTAPQGRMEAPVMRLLRIEAPHFVAGAVWEKRNNQWRAVPKQTAPILRWMIGKKPSYVQDYLLRKRWAYQWSGARLMPETPR